MAKGKHIRRANKPRATAEIITHKPLTTSSHQKLHDIEIKLKTKEKVSTVWLRFGRLQTKTKGDYTYTWDNARAVGPVKINPGKAITVAKLDKDQIPEDASHCMMLCEIYDKHGHLETLMTPPTLIMSAEKP